MGGRATTRVLGLGVAVLMVGSVLLPSVAAAPVPASGGSSQAAPAAGRFRDVPAGAYYAGGAEWLATEGITTGLASDPSRFDPGGRVTRGQMAAFLWRFAGEPSAGTDCGFTDVDPGKFFAEATCWLKAEGITTGFNNDETTFAPGVVVTRDQMALFLWRFADSPATAEPCGFTDVRAGAGFAQAACWARASDITTGVGGNPALYGPRGQVTRGQMAAFLDRLASNHEAWLVEPPAKVRFRCEQLDPRACLLPFPSNHFTKVDASTSTGLRLDLPRESMPANSKGVRIATFDQNRADGFSPGSALLFHAPTADLERSGAAPITDIGSSLDTDSAVVIINTTTGERHPHWVELSEPEPDPRDKVTYIRPAVNFDEATRYVVVIRNLVDASGQRLESSPAFASLRDGTPAPSPAVEQRRQYMDDEVFDVIDAFSAADNGVTIEREDLYLAWDFTVVSPRSLAGRLLKMRDETFAELGDEAPIFTITRRVPGDCPGLQDAALRGCLNPYVTPDGKIRKVDGLLTVPNYLQGSGGPGTRFQNYDVDGLPERNPSNPDLQIPFWCAIPREVTAENKARPVLLGHGLLGTAEDYIKMGSGFDWVVTEGNAVLCGVDLWGLTGRDLTSVLGLLQDMSGFRSVPDRGQQALLATLVLGRALKHPQGLGTSTWFRNGGQSILETDELYYSGLSMGGIMGGALMGVAQDVDRALLAVPGMNYSTMLERSALGAVFLSGLERNYPRAIDRAVGFGLVQLLWDRAESNGYAHHITSDPYGEGGAVLPEFGATPVKDILIFMAYADESAPNITTEVLARTLGIGVRAPVLRTNRPESQGGNDPMVEPLWGIDRITEFPHDGSGMLVWDFENAPPPITNTAPPVQGGPHTKGGDLRELRELLFEYFRPGGQFIDVCPTGEACFGQPG